MTKYIIIIIVYVNQSLYVETSCNRPVNRTVITLFRSSNLDSWISSNENRIMCREIQKYLIKSSFTDFSLTDFPDRK